MRPARPLAPIATAATILAIWFLIAHNSGAGWVQVLGDIVFGVLVIGILGPSFVLARATIRLISAPADGVAGGAVVLRIAASTRVRLRPSDPAGDEVLVGQVGHGGAPDEVILRPTRRGVIDAVVLDVATAAPFALQWWTRRTVLALPSPLHVAPRQGQPEPISWRPHDELDEHTDRTQADAGQPRGARPYTTGDSRRHVHWQATAHVGHLMMREFEHPLAVTATVSVVLPPDPEEAERVAERAFGTVVLLLERGTPVVLNTMEAAGGVSAPVTHPRQAGRRLARAVSPSHPSIDVAGVTVTP
ncbi:MAG: DUF58 domain-containing protein [Acidimicrobiales bacterium]